MAVVVNQLDGSLRITFIVDKDVDGNPINPPVERTRSYGPIKATATDQDVYDFAQALINLQEYSADTIERVKLSELIGA